MGISRRRIAFMSLTLGFVSRAYFVRVFVQRASKRVLEHRRLEGVHRLRVLHDGVCLEGVFRVCVRAPGE